jgi:hypothetical protein
MQCTNCSKELKSENDLKREICFACHVKGIRFGFVGVEYGQSSWNNSTIKETQDMYAKMPNVEKISTRKELI